MTEEQNELQKKREAEVEEYITALDKTHNYNIKLFDKQSLLIGTGAIVVSLSFLTFLRDKQMVCLGGFYFAEVLFILSLLVSLFSSLYSSEIAINNLKIAYAFKRQEKIEGKIREWKYTSLFNWSTALLLVVGITFMCYFAVANIENFKH